MPGHNNWYKINLNRELDNSKIKFEVEFDVPATLELDFKLASDSAAHLISSNYDNLHLCFSGGLDSEYIANVLVRNKIEFVPVILIMNNFDPKEYWYARYFCDQHNLKPVIIDYRERLFDLQKLMLQKSVEIHCDCNVAFAHHVIAHHLPDASLLTGAGHPLKGPAPNYDEPHGEELVVDEYDFYLDISYNSRHPGGFFNFTPDIFFSFIKNIDLSVNAQISKSKLYNIPFRPKLDLRFKEYLPDIDAIQKIANKFVKPLDMRQVYINRQTLLNKHLTTAACPASSRYTNSAAYATMT